MYTLKNITRVPKGVQMTFEDGDDRSPSTAEPAPINFDTLGEDVTAAGGASATSADTSAAAAAAAAAAVATTEVISPGERALDDERARLRRRVAALQALNREMASRRWVSRLLLGRMGDELMADG